MKLTGFTFKQQILKYFQDTLTYFSLFPNLWKTDGVLQQTMKKKCNSNGKDYCYFLGVKTLSWIDMCYKITQTVKP